MQLRDYQIDTVNDLRQVFIRTPAPRRVVVRMPTGAGKTAVLMEVARSWKRGKVLWLTHRMELLQQAQRQAELWGIEDGKMAVWTPGKLYNRIKKAKEFGGCAWEGLGVDAMSLLIVDEAHHSTARTWETVIGDFPGDVIGTTATVWRLKKTEGFDHIFSDMVEGPTMTQLTQMGYLSPVRAWHVPEHEIAGHGYNAGDYSAKATEAHISTRANEYAVAWAVGMCEDYAIPKRIIAFCLTVTHAERVAHIFEEMGCQAGIVHASSPAKERKATVAAFGRGDIEVLCNVNICTEGFDVPDARCVLMLRPTKSKSLYLQMVGRGTRPVAGKDFCMLLDATRNVAEFGLPAECDENTNWMLEQRGETGDAGATPVKECHACHALCHAGCNRCPECGAELRVACQGCGRRKTLGDLREGMCKECLSDFSADFSKSKEVLPLNLRWREARSGNLTATYHTDARDYRIVVLPSRFDSKWGYQIYCDAGSTGHAMSRDKGAMVCQSFRSKDQGAAVLRGTIKLRDVVAKDLALDVYDEEQAKAMPPPPTSEGYTTPRQFGMVLAPEV